MKHISISLGTAAVLLVCLAFMQCRKKDDGPSATRQNLTGSWKITAYGVDMNGNKVLDLDEAAPAPENPAITNVFAADGTGSTSMSYSGFPLTSTNTWELSNDDKTLKVVASTNGAAVTRYYVITLISVNDLVLADTSGSQRNFIVSKKI